MKKNYFLFLTILIGFCNCQKSSNSSTMACDAGTSYSKTVKPIIITNCTKSSCHDGNSLSSLDNYDIVHDGAVQIKSDVISGRMPRGSALKDNDKDAILCWIDNGAQNN